MFTYNISGKYDISGTNAGVAYCLSTDAKPTGAPFFNGFRCLEMDTGKEYRYNEAAAEWVEQG